MVERTHRSGSAGRRAVAAAVAVLVLAACGTSSSDDADRVAPTTTTTAPSAAAAPAPTAPPSVTSPVPTTAPADLRTTDLVHRTYRVLCPGGEQDVDASVPTAVDGGGAPLTLAGFVPRFVDLTGDGRVEALLPVTCLRSDDLSSATDSVVVVGVDGAAPVQLGGPVPGRDPVVVGQVLATGRPQPAAGEAPCCAALVRYEAVAYVGGTWAQVATPGTVTEADPLVPEGLGSLAIDTPYGELAIASGAPVDVTGGAATEGACTTLTFAGAPAGVRGFGGDGALRALRIEAPAIRTGAGLGVGSSEADVSAAVGWTLEAYDLPGGGRELVDVPADNPELITTFEVWAGTVVAVLVGHQGWAEEGGGCPG